MIRFALAGLTDPRHRPLAAPLLRRRAGIRPVGFWEADARAREDFALRTGLPGFTEMAALLAERAPQLVGITGAPDAVGAAAREALRSASIIVSGPACRSLDELTLLEAEAREHRRSVATLHTLRAHPASRLARELLDQGILGRVESVVLEASEVPTEHEVTETLTEVIDLGLWLTGAQSGTVTASIAGADDDPQDRLLVSILGGSETGVHQFQLRRVTDPGVAPLVVQVIGDRGALEWDLHTGASRCLLDGQPLRQISCGPPGDLAEWVLRTQVRVPDAQRATPAAGLVTTRIALLAGESARRGGTPLAWQVGSSSTDDSCPG